MMTIAVLSQKGGAGKTTLTLNLGVEAERDKKTTLIVDLDPQASATTWRDVRAGDTPVVVSAQHNRLKNILEEAEKNGAELTIIDTSPNSETASLTAARASDFVIIPCRPHLLDLQAIKMSIQICELAKKPFAVLLNAVPPKGSLLEEGSEIIANQGARLAPVQFGHRAAYYHCLSKGQGVQEYEPTGKAADEVAQLYRWLITQVEESKADKQVASLRAAI